jgi:hypothetical protein
MLVLSGFQMPSSSRYSTYVCFSGFMLFNFDYFDEQAFFRVLTTV